MATFRRLRGQNLNQKEWWLKNCGGPTETARAARYRRLRHAFSRPLEDHQRHHKFWRRRNHPRPWSPNPATRPLLFEIDGPARLAQLEQHPGRRLDGGRRVPVLGLGGLGKPLARQLGEPFPRDLGARRGAALPVSGVAEPKHLKKMTSPFPCGILSLRNLLLHST